MSLFCCRVVSHLISTCLCSVVGWSLFVAVRDADPVEASRAAAAETPAAAGGHHEAAVGAAGRLPATHVTTATHPRPAADRSVTRTAPKQSKHNNLYELLIK